MRFRMEGLAADLDTCAAGFAPCGPSHSDHSRNSHVGYLSAQGDEGGMSGEPTN